MRQFPFDSFYAKEVRTKDTNVIYYNAEVTYNGIPNHIRFLIPDAVMIEGRGFKEFVSRSSIASVELYLEGGEK